MSAVVGNQAHVTVEFADGRVLNGEAIATTLTMEQDGCATFDGPYIVGPPHWSMQLEGIGGMFKHQDFADELETKRNASAWQCWHCGAVNPREQRKCDGCNAWRTVLLG